VGVVTDRDVCMAAYTQGKPLRAIPVTVAASRSVHSVRPDAAVEVAEAVMKMHRIRRLPVLDIGGNLVGMLSLADIVRCAHARPAQDEDDGLGADRIVSTLESVYRPAAP
jgi:CBS-domain-containing membrane protein